MSGASIEAAIERARARNAAIVQLTTDKARGDAHKGMKLTLS